MSSIELHPTNGSEKISFDGCQDLRLYWSEHYKRWTVDILDPPERKTFQSRYKAESFAKAKKNELVRKLSGKF